MVAMTSINSNNYMKRTKSSTSGRQAKKGLHPNNRHPTHPLTRHLILIRHSYSMGLGSTGGGIAVLKPPG